MKRNSPTLQSAGVGVGWFVAIFVFATSHTLSGVSDSSPLHEKANYFQRDLLDKHWLDGLYVSIVPAAPAGTK